MKEDVLVVGQQFRVSYWFLDILGSNSAWWCFFFFFNYLGFSEMSCVCLKLEHYPLVIFTVMQLCFGQPAG